MIVGIVGLGSGPVLGRGWLGILPGRQNENEIFFLSLLLSELIPIIRLDT